MPSSHTPSGESTRNKNYLGSAEAYQALAEAFPDAPAKKAVKGTHTITADDKSNSTGIPDAGSSAMDGAGMPLSTADQKLLDEFQETITPFGRFGGVHSFVSLADDRRPPERAVKIKLPGTSRIVPVHGYLLILKSILCRAQLTKIAEKGGPRDLELPTTSAATVIYFLKWMYNHDILPARGRSCSGDAEHSVTWPDLINLWVFARKMRIPKLQNHATDILVRKIHGSLELNNLKDEEVDHRRAAFNLLWPGKHQARGPQEDADALGPLRRLMMDWFANPTYQTKAEANQLLAGGISRGFYRDYALHLIQKNFSRGDHDLEDEGDSGGHLEMMEEVAQQTLRCYWNIKPERYYVEEYTFATPYKFY